MKLGSEFMPPLEEGDLLYMPSTFPAVSVGKAQELLQQTDKLIKTVPEVKRVFGKVVCDEPFATHSFAIVIQRRAEVVPPVAGAESVELVKAASVRVIRVLHAVVPLSKCSGRVTSFAKQISNRCFVWIQSFLASANAADARSRMVSTGQKLRARRRTNLVLAPCSHRFLSPIGGRG